MIDANSDQLCKEAELYYYDFAFGKSRESTPVYISQHIDQCQHCQNRLNQLKLDLLQADSAESEQSQVNSAVALILKLHFGYLGKPVTCQAVRPFLPTLLDPVLNVRIPTPITAHLDNCRRCSEDLDTLRGLQLNRKQLSRLSQLFAEVPSKDKVSCSQARSAILFVVLMTLREVEADVLKYICTCPDCRKALYEYRQATCEELENETEEIEFPCKQVSAADIFDYVVPYGLDPANDPYARFRESLTSHIRRCPRCLAKMQKLHETVYGIIEQPESEIATIYSIQESLKVQSTGQFENLYSDFPVNVEILNREESEAKVDANESAPAVSSRTILKQKILAVRIKPTIRAGVVVAVAILIAVALLLNTPTAKGVTIEQIYKALDKIRNVYIASFVSEKKEPVQEKWMSRALNVYMTKTGKQLVLWDLQNKVKKTKYLDSNSVETTVLSDDIIAEIRERIAGFVGLMPFDRMSAIPRDAEWSRVTDNSLESTTRDREVYDLTWVKEAYDVSVTFRKWRFFVDSRTNLPCRIEIYQKLPAEDEYIFMSSMEVKYLSDSKMQGIIRDIFSGQ